MATEILLPKLGFSRTEALRVDWMVQDGAAVKKGQAIYGLESEKAVQEIEAIEDGVLKILKPAGETYEVGTLIGEIS